MKKPALVALYLGLLVFAQTNTQIEIKRDDTDIVITNFGSSADGAKSILANKNCKEGVVTRIFYAPGSYVETISDKTTLTSEIALIEKQSKKAEDADGFEETLELFGGSMEFNRPKCPVNVQRSAEPDVSLKQGKTTVKGVNFFLDKANNIGLMKGLITLKRSAKNPQNDLNASAEILKVNLDNNAITLSGNVKITSAGRVSTADRLEYDDENAIAILYGNPAVSKKDSDILKSDIIIYYLDSNDVVAKGHITGEFIFDTGSDERPSLGFSKPNQDNP